MSYMFVYFWMTFVSNAAQSIIIPPENEIPHTYCGGSRI